MTKKSSRLELLAKKEEKAVIKRIIYLSLISLILAIFVFKLGIPILGKFADLLDGVFQKGNTASTVDSSAPEMPSLDKLPAATNSAKLKISGFAPNDITVDIYENSQKTGSTVSRDGKFNLEDFVLTKGKNEIYAKTVSKSGKESGPSDTQTVVLDTDEPKLEVAEPEDGQSFSGSNRIKVSGKTDKDSQVFANGFLGSIDSDGKFEVFVPVLEGENKIEIKAVSIGGNTKTETRKINYKK